jgi:hypothetical protein
MINIFIMCSLSKGETVFKHQMRFSFHFVNENLEPSCDVVPLSRHNRYKTDMTGVL